MGDKGRKDRSERYWSGQVYTHVAAPPDAIGVDRQGINAKVSSLVGLG